MLQLKKAPFRLKLSPFIRVVRGFLTAFVTRRQRLTIVRLPRSSNSGSASNPPTIEVSAVPLVESPVAAEPLPLLIPTPEPESTEAEKPPTEGDVEPQPELHQQTAELSQAELLQSLAGDRSRQVTELLDEAAAQGLSTYPQLMEYVKERTGTSCSRRTISNWKKARASHANENLSCQ